MLVIIIFIFGLVSFVEAIFSKFFIYDKFREFAFKSNKFIYKLANCNFCIRFWISVICSFVVSFLFVLEYGLILAPFVVSGYYKIFEDVNRG